MSLKRYATARDANEAEIVAALRQAGATVVLLDTPVDLLVGWRGQNLLMEVKLPPGPRGGTTHSPLTPDQIDFFQTWPGRAYVVRSPEQALRALEEC